MSASAKSTPPQDHAVTDLSLADWGRKEIQIAETEMPGLMAIRDSEPASEALGVDVFRTKLAVYVLAAFGTGTTGALVYLNLLRISPDAAFSINWTAYTIFIVVIGGLGTLEGPIVGTIVFFLLREALADYGAWYMILLGALAVLAMMQCPQGVWGLVAARWDLRFFPVQRRLSARGARETRAG